MALSDVQIRSLKPTDKLYKVTDGKGLYLEVSPNGSKLWCQSASKRDPLSACKRGPPGGVALGLITGTDFALGLA